MATLAIQEEQSETILAQAAAGDETAFARLVAAHHADMRRVAYIVCHDKDMADDACQQAWQISLRRLSNVRQSASLRSWLVAVAANEARKLIRRQRRRLVIEATVRPLWAYHDDPAEAIDQADLSTALSHLTPDDRALVALRYYADLDSTQIASLLGGSASGTRARLARILGRLRKELHDD